MISIKHCLIETRRIWTLDSTEEKKKIPRSQQTDRKKQNINAIIAVKHDGN